MFYYVFWVVTSLFAVIGVLHCLLGVVEAWSLHRNRTVCRAVLQIELRGEEPHTEYLLNTLSVVAGRLAVGTVEAELELKDSGLSEKTRREVAEYCEKNPWVLFTDGAEDGIIE